MSTDADKKNYMLLPNSDKHNCFGCSPNNEYGLHMKFYTNDKKDMVVSWFAVPDQYCGWGTMVHGGIISTMLDEAMGWGAAGELQLLYFNNLLFLTWREIFTVNRLTNEYYSVMFCLNMKKIIYSFHYR
jgi:hypothetical protein